MRHNITGHSGLHSWRMVFSKRATFRNRPSARYPTVQFFSTLALGVAAETADSYLITVTRIAHSRISWEEPMIVMRKDQGTPLEVGEARCHITLASDRDTAAAATNTALSITGIMQDGAHVSLILQTDEAAELFALLQAADAA